MQQQPSRVMNEQQQPGRVMALVILRTPNHVPHSTTALSPEALQVQGERIHPLALETAHLPQGSAVGGVGGTWC